MEIVKGDLFSFQGEFLLVTTNSYIKKDGSLVMGRGAAYQANQMTGGTLAKELGKLITNDCGHLKNYTVLFTAPRRTSLGTRFSLGAFQVKYHFKSNADPQLIEWSSMSLSFVAQMMPEHTFAVNFPGIGNGGLRREEVLPIISMLPNNVKVYER